MVEKIKAVPNEARLLVVDQAADRYFADKGITISSELSCIEHFSCPLTKPSTGSYSRYFSIDIHLLQHYRMLSGTIQSVAVWQCKLTMLLLLHQCCYTCILLLKHSNFSELFHVRPGPPNVTDGSTDRGVQL